MVGSLVENLDADAEDVTEAFVSFVVATLRRHARSRRSRRRFGRRADTAVTGAPGAVWGRRYRCSEAVAHDVALSWHNGASKLCRMRKHGSMQLSKS